MEKKDKAKKTTGKSAKASKPTSAVKTKETKAKVPAKTQRKGTPTKDETTFKLEAPQAEQVCIVGCFNEWDPTANPLERDEKGTWICSLAIEPGEHEYRFVVDGIWWDDPDNMCRRPNIFGTQNCVIII